MNIYCIKLNKFDFCIGYTITQELQDDMIEVTSNIYPSNVSFIGRKFDVENREWLDEYDETLKIDEPKTEPIEPTPSQLDNIEQTQLVMMEAMADQYEESQERELTNMDVLATMYEEILSIKGEE